MAAVPATLIPSDDISYLRVKWEGFAASGDVGGSVAMPVFPDRTVQALGTFAGGLEITIEGSLDGGTTWFTLTDPQGNSLVKTSAAGEAVTELVPLIRPRATAGSGGGDVDVYLFMGGNRQ
jgi:hypothetical protein